MATPAGLGAVADPRISAEPDAIGSYRYDRNTGKPMYRANRSNKLHDPDVSFEEYHFYANIEREYERTLETSTHGLASILPVSIGKLVGVHKDSKTDRDMRTGSVTAPRQLSEKIDGQGPGVHANASDASSGKSDPDQKAHHGDFAEGQHDSSRPPIISEGEWHTASRAARTATWGAVFYLITTDILGPFSVPWAISQLGYGPGAALYTVFGIMAFYSGTQLWKQFLGLDSEKYPIKSYGDLAYRIYGFWGRHIANVLQSLQFFLNVTLLIVGNGQGIAQLAKGPAGHGFLCFVVAEVVFAAAGFLLGQIRTLQRLSYIANIAVWLNIFILIMTMVITNNSEPNWDAVWASYKIPEGPIYHTASTPPDKTFVDQINGLMQAVYSYGGATLFNELMAEMRRPHDFWKGLIAAETFIFACYIIFGMVVYAAQGQATFNPAYQGINPYTWQTVGNVFSLVSGLIAACLYGNIGIKVLYANVGRSFLKFPPLESKKGKWLWVGLVPLYWGLAFLIAAAVPSISYLSAFVGASMILQFTYTFPPLLMIGYNIHKDAMLPEETFDPATGEVHRIDGGFARIWRGYKKQLLRNLFDTFYFLGALTTAVLGIYASIVGMIKQFGGTSVQPFSCDSPTG